MKLKCMIVDDEPFALALLEKYITQTNFLELKYRCKNAVFAQNVLLEDNVDIVFLDIHMPGITGMEFAKVIGKNTRIIFTTAFREYAIEGYKVNALDYLVKPFDYDEFLVAAQKAKDWFDFLAKEAAGEKDYIFIRAEYKQIKIMLEDVIYFEGLKDYVKVWLKGRPKPILTLLSLKSLEKELPFSRFMRIHRSFIIAYDKIKLVEKNQVAIGDIRITIARQYKESFQTFLAGKLLG